MAEEQENEPILKRVAAETDSAFRLAANMLVEDTPRKIIPLFAILTAPSILLTSFQGLEQASLFVEILNRLLMLLALYWVAKRWLKIFSGHTQALNPSLAALIAYGVCYWLALLLPLSLAFLLPGTASILGLFLLLPALLLSLRFYFYFLAPLCGITDIQENIQMTKSITSTHTMIAVKALLAPLGIMVLLSSLALAISPDGRELIALYLVDLASGVFAVLSLYTSLAFSFCFVPLSWSQRVGLDHERIQAYASKDAVDQFWLPPLLSVKRGVALFLVGLLVSLGNNMRADIMAPAPELQVEDVAASKEKLLVTIHAKDSSYHFRSFRPGFFRLSGDTGKDIGLNIPEISIDGEKVPPFLQLHPETAEVTITLSFDPKKSPLITSMKDLEKAKDLSLWYRQHKVASLSLNLK